MKPPPWLLVMDFLLVEIRTEKGTPARSINLESSTLEQEPMRRGGLIELQVPAMINKNIYPSPGKENRKDKTEEEEEEEACGGGCSVREMVATRYDSARARNMRLLICAACDDCLNHG